MLKCHLHKDRLLKLINSYSQRIVWVSLNSLKNGRPAVIDRRNRVCDRRKALSNGHHDCQYLDETTTSNSNNNNIRIFF